MDASSIKSRPATRPTLVRSSEQGTRGRLLSPSQREQISRQALQDLDSRLRASERTAQASTQTPPPMSEAEALGIAERIADRVHASGKAFGSNAISFHNLSPERTKDLLI
ncbi:hypothetical protein MRY87_03625 [bacterium]|nr:hypothetical protein [bacterium]